MEDFTGGVSEWFDLKEAPANLFSILQKAAERNSMMGCSIEADPNVLEAETPQGLIRGHAYSITKVLYLLFIFSLFSALVIGVYISAGMPH